MPPFLPERCNYTRRLGLPWYCPAVPVTLADGRLQWTFRWEPPVPGLAAQELIIADGCAVSFEDEAARIEYEICKVRGVVCVCCAGNESQVCDSCVYATGFHYCKNLPGRHLWKKGCLHGGTVDFQRVVNGSPTGLSSVLRLRPVPQRPGEHLAYPRSCTIWLAKACPSQP